MNVPSPTVIRFARTSAGLTQANAAALIHQPQPRWAEYENGTGKPSRAAWELFLLLTHQHPTFVIRKKPTLRAATTASAALPPETS